MSWILKSIQSSIGKKVLMAVTGFCFIGFLVIHLGGNLFIYGGKESFNSYAEHLHSLGNLLLIGEFGLLAFALIHVLTGTILFFQNFTSRPVRYSVKKSRGGRTWSSATMPYSGFLIVIFIFIHLSSFTFVDKTGTTIFDIIYNSFKNPVYSFYYVITLLVLGFHIRHGFWSLFQTLGLSHPKYMPGLMCLGKILGFVFAVGFALIPLYVLYQL